MLKIPDARGGVVYIATDLSNNKQYVGQTLDFKRRIQEHLRGFCRKTRTLFDCAIRGRGIGGFKIIQLLYPVDELNFWEEFWISKLNSLAPFGYNLTGGGKAPRGKDHPMYGKKHSEEAREKMRLAHSGERNHNYGKKFTEEHKRKLSESGKKRITSEKTREKQSVSQKRRFTLNPKLPGTGTMLGKKHTLEARKKMSLARRGRIFSELHRKHLSESETGEKNHQYRPELHNHA